MVLKQAASHGYFLGLDFFEQSGSCRELKLQSRNSLKSYAACNLKPQAPNPKLSARFKSGENPNTLLCNVHSSSCKVIIVQKLLKHGMKIRIQAVLRELEFFFSSYYYYRCY